MLVWLNKMVFGTTFWHSFLNEGGERLGKGKTSAKKDSHEYDLTADTCFGLATHNVSSKWVAITSVPTFF
jgi:hypothetical protein